MPASEEVSEHQPETIDIGHLALTAPPYVRVELSARSLVEPHEAPVQQLSALVSRIVAIEGPIHVDELARRIAAAFGRSRTGNRIVDAASRAVRWALQHDTELRRDGAFLMTSAQAETPPVRDRSSETGTVLKAEYLPPIEIAAAEKLVRSANGAISENDLIRAIARLLGFMRVGPEILNAISSAIKET